MRSKDRVGVLTACWVRDDRREDPSLPALHRVWTAFPGGIRSLSLLCVSPFFYPEADVLVLGIATYKQLFCLARSIARLVSLRCWDRWL